MQTASCSIAIGGDLGGTYVPRESITPAEYLVLAAIHGGREAIRNLEIHPQDVERSGADEKRRLKDLYERQPKLVDSMFPGFSPQLPTTFAQVTGEEGYAPDVPVDLANKQDMLGNDLPGESDVLG